MEKTKPAQVALASRIMWVLWGIGSLPLAVGWIVALVSHAAEMTTLIPLGVMYVVVVGLFAALIRCVSKGKNWARITYGALACGAIAIVVFSLLANPQVSVLGILFAGGIVLAYAIVLSLLFHRGAGPWFAGPTSSQS